MAPITSILISNIRSAQISDIAHLLWNKGIAQVRKITVQPYLDEDKVRQYAYVLINQWRDTEVAYDFIQQLKNKTKQTKLAYEQDETWVVQINTHNDGDIDLCPYTMEFHDIVFVPKHEEDEEAIEDDAIEDEEEEASIVSMDSLGRKAAMLNRLDTSSDESYCDYGRDEERQREEDNMYPEPSYGSANFEDQPIIEMYDVSKTLSINEAKDRIKYLEGCLRAVITEPDLDHSETAYWSIQSQLADFYEDQRSTAQNNFCINQEVEFLQQQIANMYNNKENYEVMLDKAVANSRHVTVRQQLY